LNKDKLINELKRRNLKSSGIVIELKDRLIRYLKGESTKDDFEIVDNKLPFIPGPLQIQRFDPYK